MELASTLRRLALEAGAAIMAVRNGADGIGAREKADGSPVTQADLAADALICAGLSAAFPGVAVVTEEQEDSWSCGAERHFLIDPLDGTRDFARGGPDFTVNIALIEAGAPVAGVIYAPAHHRLFLAAPDVAPSEEAPSGARPLRVAPRPEALRVVASKSHRDPATDAWIAERDVADVTCAGSSLKFCLLAAGEADLYPRLTSIMEWDVAAGHAILAAAGGMVREMGGAPLLYGRKTRRLPPFLALAGAGLEGE